MLPQKKVRSIYQIDWNELGKAGIKGIITDLDNTLVGTTVPKATTELIHWLQDVKKRGLQVVIVSNNNYARVSAFAEPLKIPFIHKAKKPISTGFRKALQTMNLRAEEAVVIGDQLLTDVLGGNRLGLYTILVKPITLNDEKLRTRMNRRVEKWVLRKFVKKGMLQEEEL